MSGEEDRSAEWRLLGERLRNVREYLNFSQQYVADRTGIARSAVSDIERGQRKVDSLELRKLAALYRYPAAYFLDGAATDPAEHAVRALARALTDLTSEDRAQVLRFAEFLRHSRGFDDVSSSGEPTNGEAKGGET